MLSKEDKETINLVIPENLSRDEMEIINNRLAALGTATPQDLVTTVIEAMQQVRPLGNQRIGPPRSPTTTTSPPPSTPIKDRPPARGEKKRLNTPRSKPPKLSPQTSHRIDLVQTLRNVIKADSFRHVTVPSEVQFNGFRANVVHNEVATLPYGTPDGTLRHYIVNVTIVPIDAVPGMRSTLDQQIEPGVPMVVIVEVSAP